MPTFTTPPVRRISGWYNGDEGPARRVVSTVHAPDYIEGYGFATDIRCPRFVISSGMTRAFGAHEAQGLELAIWGILAWYEHHGVRDIVIETVDPDDDETVPESADRIVIDTPPVRWISGWYSGGDGPDRRVLSTVHEPKRVKEFHWAADIRCPRFVISSGTTRAFGIDEADSTKLATGFILSMYEHHGVHDIVIATEDPGDTDG